MFYKVLADIVVLVHFLWILFLIFGVFWGVRCFAAKVAHIAGLAFALVLNAFGWYCPLTYLESWAHSMHDDADAYAGSFIIHYLEELIYIEEPRSVLLALTLILVAFNAWYYLKRGRSSPS